MNTRELEEEIDKTIKSICKRIRKDNTLGDYAETVKALTTLVEARAKLC